MSLKEFYLQACSLAFDLNQNDELNTKYHAKVDARYFSNKTIVQLKIHSCTTGLAKHSFVFDSLDTEEEMREKFNCFKQAIEDLLK